MKLRSLAVTKTLLERNVDTFAHDVTGDSERAGAIRSFAERVRVG